MSDVLQNTHASLDNSQNEVYEVFFYFFNYMAYDQLHIPTVKLSTKHQETNKKVNYNEKHIKKIPKTITTLHQ